MSELRRNHTVHPDALVVVAPVDTLLTVAPDGLASTAKVMLL